MTQEKPRGNSQLKTLPDQRQEQLVEFARNHTLAQCKEWLAQDGIKVSPGSISRFLSWFHLRSQIQMHRNSVTSLQELLRSKLPDLPPGKLEEYGDALFSVQALAAGNPELYLRMRSLKARMRHESAKLHLEERRVKLLEEKAAKADAVEVVTHSTLSEAEKAKRIREIFNA